MPLSSPLGLPASATSSSAASGTYTPLVTPGPSQDAMLRHQGFTQLTFYTCVTAPSGHQHCGWHVPIVKDDTVTAAASTRSSSTGTTSRAAAVAVSGIHVKMVAVVVVVGFVGWLVNLM